MPTNLKQVDLLQNYRNWRQGTGVFEGFVRATPFVSLQHYPDFPLDLSLPDQPGTEEEQKLLSSVQTLAGADTLVIIDLPGVQALRNAYHLQAQLKIKPVLVMANPLHARGLVGDQNFINQLLAIGENLPKLQQPQGYALIMDYNRYDNYPDEAYQNFFNNQYELTEDELPDFDLLSWTGIKKTAVFTTAVLKEDLSNYLDYLKEQGLEVLVINSGESEQVDRHEKTNS